MKSTEYVLCVLSVFWAATSVFAVAGEEWKPLFNDKDLTGWKVPDGDNGHWKVVNGVIDYDAMSESPKDKDLWTEESFGDFELTVEWRIKETKGNPEDFTSPAVLPNGSKKLDVAGKPVMVPGLPIILPDGSYKRDSEGNPITVLKPNADSGIYLRGSSKAQVNIWCWPCGSGEIWGYRTNPKMSAAVRAGCVPKVCADKPVGEWNRFDITVKSDRVTVKLNDQLVIDNAALPGMPVKGPIGLQHHGGFNKQTGRWFPASSLMQFRNIRIRPL